MENSKEGMGNGACAKCMAQHGGMCGGCCGGHHGIVRIIIKIAVILLVFCAGVQFGELRAYMHGAYSGGGRGNMMGGYGRGYVQSGPNMMYRVINGQATTTQQ